MVLLELIPISTLLALLTTEILETAVAAQDVLVEKETFKVLSTYLMNIQPILLELRKRNIGDSQATRQALGSLQEDLKKAKSVVNFCNKKSRFYQLVHCRSIVKEAQQVTRDIGKSLALLSLATTDVSVDISKNVEKLKDQMLKAEFEASEQKLQIIDKIELGVKQQRTDQGFVNDLITEIARAIGVPVDSEDSEIRKELTNFKREKEEAAERKEKEEEAFMEQIIALLSRADATRTPEDMREEYVDRRYRGTAEEEQPPLQSFLCPLSEDVMRDPVSVVTGHSYERSRIQQWFGSGERTDPVTKMVLNDLTLRPNHKIKESIEEWVDRNYSIRIRNARRKLESGDEVLMNEASGDLSALCDASSKIKQRIAEEGLVVHIVTMLKSHNKEVKRKNLLALNTIIAENDDNKKQLVDAGGLEQVVRCLARNINLSKVAVALLLELLYIGTPGNRTRNLVVYLKLSRETGAILLLVTLLNGEDEEARQNARKILEELCDNDQNIVEMAKANWYTPLIDHLSHGSNESKLIMANALATLELTEVNKQDLGNGGAIPPLVRMISGNLEGKSAALKALQSLSSFGPNKRYMAEAGATPLVLQHVFSGRFPVSVRESSSAILENLVLHEGTRFLVEPNGHAIDLEKTIQSLLVVQDNSSGSPSVRKHLLLTLLGLVSPPFAHEARKLLKDASGISVFLLLLECPDREIRDVAVQLLCCLSHDCGESISLYLTQKRLAGIFVNLLHDSTKGDIQAAAAGILANLPLSESSLTAYLVQESVIPAIVYVLNNGNLKSKENAIGSLLRFTLPSNVDVQRKVVELGIYPILRGLISSGTTLAKVGAAKALTNFSMSTWKLSTPPSMSGCLWMLKKAPPKCRVHPGPCGERTTFCLLEAGVIPDLISLLNEQESEIAGAGVDALSTLVVDGEILEKGAKLLHEERAVEPVLELLSLGTASLKEKGIYLLEKIFKAHGMAEYYGVRARMPLVELATNGESSIRRQAAKVLALLQSSHGPSNSF